jgi:hypothetical protein
VEGEDENEQQHGPSQNMGWLKEEPADFIDGLERCVNSLQVHSSPVIKLHKIKIEEDTEDELPLVGG